VRDSHLTSAYLDRRSRSIDAFELWLAEHTGVPPATLYRSGILLARFLATFGVWLHDAGFPHYILVHAILGIQSAHPHWKAFLTEAWDVAKQWKLAEPPKLRPPLPRALLRAMVGLCFAWDWPVMAALLLMGFTMFLRPGELLASRRCDLSLPCDRLEVEGDAFLSILVPKTRRTYPTQHARCSDRGTVKILNQVFGRLASTDPLAPFGASGFRTRWNHLLSALGVPLAKAGQGLNLTPACLRGSGATDFYIATEDVPRVFWRGRWRQASSAERYLQAAAASTVLAALPVPARARILFFATASDRLVASFLQVGPAAWPALLAAARRNLVTSQGP
jgi:hypothetical protein